MNLLITGGGTGGHLAIAKAVALECPNYNITPIYIGSIRGQDRKWFEGSTLFKATYFLPTKGVVDKKGIQKIIALKDTLVLAQKAKSIIQSHNIDAILSVGGYAAAPASIAAIISKIPFFIHEQNAIMGRLNKLLSPFAKRVFCSFTPPYDPYPVRPIFFATQRIRTQVTTILFLGGSQGAQQINDIALTLAPHLVKRGIHIIHQTGKRDYERVHNFYASNDIAATYFAFSHNLEKYIAQADLAVSRAGASTLWELAANGLPALYLPYPFAANNHQYYNAAFFVQRQGGWFYTDPQQVLKLLEKDLSSYSKNLLALAQPDGAKHILTTLQYFIK